MQGERDTCNLPEVSMMQVIEDPHNLRDVPALGPEDILSTNARYVLARVAALAPEPFDATICWGALGPSEAQEATEELRIRNMVRFVAKNNWRVILSNEAMRRLARARVVVAS